jgi:hypothetical protein
MLVKQSARMIIIIINFFIISLLMPDAADRPRGTVVRTVLFHRSTPDNYLRYLFTER